MSASTPLIHAEFLPVTPESIYLYQTFSGWENDRNADFSPGNIYLWDDTYHQEIAVTGERAVVRFPNQDGSYRYLYPVGKGPLFPAIEAILQTAPANDICFVGVTEAGLNAFSREFSGKFIVQETRDFEDYLYRADSLATLSGKKLHAKRNHINAFAAAHEWTLTPLTPADFPSCREILGMWEKEHLADSVRAEHRAISRAFDAFDTLALSGALLRVDGTSAAFCIGEKISCDTYCVHFEKASPAHTDAYPVINREFVRMITAADPTILYINREEDMGLENLRAAKLSYHPENLVKKYTVRLRTNKSPDPCIFSGNMVK